MTTLKTLLKTTLTPIALCLTLAIAIPVMAKKGHHQKHDDMRQILSELSLTDIQKQYIRQILKQNREDRELFSTDGKSLKIDMRSLVQSSEWDEEAVQSVITQRQALMQQKALQRATNKNQVWNLLTATQQAEFATQLASGKAKLEALSYDGERKGKYAMLKRLDLTEEQLAAVDSIKTAARVNDEATKKKLKTFKQAERVLVQSKDFSTEAWHTLSNKYKADFLAMAFLKAKTQHDIWNLLTPEQQTQAGERNKGKKEKHGNKGKRHQQKESA